MESDLQPITGTADRTPDVLVDLDPRAEVRLMDAGDDFGIVLSDGGVEVVINLPRNAGAYLLVMNLAQRMRALEPEIRAKTVGYRPKYAAEHNAHTGPGVFR